MDCPADGGCAGCYPPLIRFLFLTATRCSEAAGLHKHELDSDVVWTIPAERYKTKLDHVVPLTPEAQALIGPRAELPGFAFSTTAGTKAFSGFSKAKTELDKTIAVIREREGREPMAQWQLHDLRRTARSLMSRAGIPTDHAERVLGHVIGGIRAAYDRHEYFAEKAAALAALARLIDRIISGQALMPELVKSQADPVG